MSFGVPSPSAGKRRKESNIPLWVKGLASDIVLNVGGDIFLTFSCAAPPT